jgi:RNA polymerase sigma-70 factor (ECF subfamily)
LENEVKKRCNIFAGIVSVIETGVGVDKDKILSEKIIHGDLKAFRSLIEAYQKLVAHIVFRLVSNPADQEEICHEIFIKVYQSLPGFKFEAKLSTWIGRIAYNMTINHMRKEKIPLFGDIITDHMPQDENDGEKRGLELIDSAHPAPDEIVEAHDRNLLIQRQLNQLPAPYRIILTLFHLEQMSYQEIGSILDLPEGTVKSNLYRGRKKLKEGLIKELQGEEI